MLFQGQQNMLTQEHVYSAISGRANHHITYPLENWFHSPFPIDQRIS